MDEFSQILVYESSYLDELSGSDDGQDEILDNAKNKALESLVRSKDKKNKQFVDMLRIRQASRYGVKLGFKGFD